MRVVVADPDRLMCRRTIALLREQLAGQLDTIALISVSSTSALYRAVFQYVPADLILLDAYFPASAGIALAQDLRLRGFQGLIVATSCTQGEQHAAKLVGSSTFLYKLDPHYPEQLAFCVRAAQYMQHSSQRKFLHVRAGVDRVVLSLGEVRYFSVEKHCVTCHWGPELHTAHYGSSLVSIEQEVAAYNFARCHRNYLINCDFVEQLHREAVVLEGGISLPVSRRFRKALFLRCEGMQKLPESDE